MGGSVVQIDQLEDGSDRSGDHCFRGWPATRQTAIFDRETGPQGWS